MGVALFIAYRALRTNETPVACIMVERNTDRILSVGFNGTNDTLNGTRHAEFLAIDEILVRYIPKAHHGDSEYIKTYFQNVILYVTVEPCIMCASALKQIGIKYVVYGCGNDRFGGNGTVLTVNQDAIDGKNGNYNSYGGILRTEAIHLLRNFYTQENSLAPIPKAKKNKEIASKEFPRNIDFKRLYSESGFKEFYGAFNWQNLYQDHQLEYEVTPTTSGTYNLEQLVSAESITRVPEVERLYSSYSKDTLQQDLDLFYQLFYDVSQFKVRFDKPIVTIEELQDHKKRKLQ